MFFTCLAAKAVITNTPTNDLESEILDLKAVKKVLTRFFALKMDFGSFVSL